MVCIAVCLLSCELGEPENGDYTRYDDAVQVSITVSGSLQNPAWSPDSQLLAFTRFQNGYNADPSDIYIYDIPTGNSTILVASSGGTILNNVNLPGSCWRGTEIVFSSAHDGLDDEIYIIDQNDGPGDEVLVTNRPDDAAYEPSFSPDGSWIVFESHPLDQENEGVITKVEVSNPSVFIPLTLPADDCREPNWSPSIDPDYDFILYQRYSGGRWDIWLMETDGSNPHQLTTGPGDKTDASFSPDGHFIVYSSDEGELEYANIYILSVSGGTPVRATDYEGYDGAPSWSPDGNTIVFESYPGDPDDSAGTTIWRIDTPTLP
jgi:TolB protein